MVNLEQISKHVEFYLNPVRKPVFQFSVSLQNRGTQRRFSVKYMFGEANVA